VTLCEREVAVVRRILAAVFAVSVWASVAAGAVAAPAAPRQTLQPSAAGGSTEHMVAAHAATYHHRLGPRRPAGDPPPSGRAAAGTAGRVRGAPGEHPDAPRPRAPITPRGDLAPGANLLVNPDAEVGTCTTSGFDAMTVPGWTVTSGATDSVCYGAVGFPRSDVPGPTDRGRAFFSGGATGDSTMAQVVNLSAAAAEIDRGEVTYRIGGWLGGWAGQNDRTTINLTFVDGRGHVMDTGVLDPVTNTDRDQVTGFVNRSTSGWVPTSTRAVIVAVTFTWTAGSTTDGYADDLSFSVDTPVHAPRLVAPASNVPAFDHVFVVFMSGENARATDAPAGRGHYVVNNPAARYLNHTVAVMGSLLGQMYATTHPGDPNQLAVSGGSTFGWTSDPVVGRDAIEAPHLGDLLDAAGLTWKAYADGAYGGCDVTEHDNASGGYYRPDQQPFMLYKDVVVDPDRCAAHNQPLTSLATDLQSTATTPSLVWFSPNDVDNMNGGGVRAGDNWLSQTLPAIFASPAWTQERSLLILSWDESYAQSFGPGFPNHVATYVLGSQDTVKPGYTSPIRYTDYSLTRTIEEALGVGSLTSNDRFARPLSDVWSDESNGSGGQGGPGDDGGSSAALRGGH